MNIKKIYIIVFIAISSISFFNACDVIEEDDIWIPVHAERNVLSELVVDENLEETTYNAFKNLNDAEPTALFMLVPLPHAVFDVEPNEAMFNREKLIDGRYGVVKDQWKEQFDFQIEKKDQGDFELTIDYELDETTAMFSCTYQVVSLNSYNENVKLTAYLLKDTIVGIQEIEVEGIVQTIDVLKTASSLNKNDLTFTGSYNLDFSNQLDLFKMSLMFSFSNSITGEVLQAEQVSFVPSEGGADPVFGTLQNILVEDFTGHKCGNCPDAHVELAELVATNGSQIIPMAIHTGYFAEVDAPDYATDFNTVVGDAIASEFGVQFTPIGMVNRVGEADDAEDKLIDYPAWGAKVLGQINNSPKVGIAVQTMLAGSDLQAKLFVKAYEEYGANLKIQAFIIENKIHADQLWYGQDTEHIHDYEHEHVLRASINGIWGEDLTTSTFNEDEVKETIVTYTLNSEWNAANLGLIVIVYDAVTKEIIQVEQKDL